MLRCEKRGAIVRPEALFTPSSNDTAEGYIDDYHFLAPTGSLDPKVMYLTLTNGTVIPFAATAALVNP